MRALAKIENALLAQQGHLFCWVPVCLGIGIGGYYQLPAEPDALIFIAMLVPIGLLYAASRVVRISFAPLLVAICLIGAGAGIAKFRTDHVAGPVLGFRYYGAIEGRVVNIDRSGSDAVRLTLDQVKLERMSSEKTPARVRVSLHGEDETANFNPADIIMTTGHLSPPSGPAEPGGFDFQRHAWFLKIGGVGYTRNPVVRLEAARPSGFKIWVFGQRIALADAVRKQIDGEAGAFAAAIMTGDRSAIFSLLIGAAYLALSGGSVATERAYIMVAVMLVAVLLDRRALTLRAVAMAATIVLIIQPEALVGPGFQMSFAATTALVLVFGQMRRFNTQRLPKWARAVLSMVLSSAVAGFATAPFAAAHFNMFAHYGLIANLLSVPLMGLVVMPAAVLAVCFAPIGGWGAGLWLMEKGLLWILYVADRVANIEGGLGHVIAPHAAVLPVLTLGLLWLSLWQGRARFAGLVVAIFAEVLWMQSTRPAFLIADSGGLIGVMGENGRALSRAKGSGFVAGIWLENDGNPVAQDIAAARGGYDVSGRETRVVLGAWKILQVSGKTALSALAGCGGADVLIATVEDQIDRPCQVFDIIALRNTGSLALEVLENGDLKITTASDVAGNRPWNAGKDLAPTGILLTLNSDQE